MEALVHNSAERIMSIQSQQSITGLSAAEYCIVNNCCQADYSDSIHFVACRTAHCQAADWVGDSSIGTGLTHS